MIRRTFVQLVLGGALLVSAIPAALAEPAKPNILIQVSDGDTKTWNQALNVIRNVQAEYGKDKVNIELVVFGHGSGLLKFDYGTWGPKELFYGDLYSSMETSCKPSSIPRQKNGSLPSRKKTPSFCTRVAEK